MAQAMPADAGTAPNDAPTSLPPKVGQPGQPVRVVAFSGGAYDTMPQLGMVHALLASDAKLPEIVAGVSAGSINAVALAETLRAGSGSGSPVERRAAQIARFMAVVEAYASAPRELLQALLPDLYQVAAQRPLQALDQPLQTLAEKADRNKAVAAKAGLIRLINDVLGVDVSVAVVTRALRLVLGWRAACEMPRRAALLEQLRTVWRGFWLVGRNLRPLLAVGVRLGLVLFAVLRRRFLPGLRATRGRTAADLIFGADSWLLRSIRFVTRFLAVLAGAAVWGSAFVAFFALLLRVACPLLAAVFPALAVPAVGLVVLDRVLVISLVIAVVLALAVFVAYRALTADGNVRLDALAHLIFQEYGVANGWFNPQPLRERYVRLFDPAYYGACDVDASVDRAMRRGVERPTPEPETGRGRTFAEYAEGGDPIQVGVVAADVANGKPVLLTGKTPVIDGLMVATALPPLFEAQKVGGTWYVDGALLVNEPTSALFPYLKERLNPEISSTHIYSVVQLPLSQTELGGPAGHVYTRLIDVARRSLRLQRFRDATLSRRMTHLYSRSMNPLGPGLQVYGRTKVLRAWVYPIEPGEGDVSLDLTRRVLTADSDDARRALILRGIAEGCRSSLEGMLPSRIRSLAIGTDGADCRTVLQAYAGDPLPLGLAGPSPGPGLKLVCERCPRTLRVRSDRDEWPEWPHRADAATPADGRAGPRRPEEPLRRELLADLRMMNPEPQQPMEQQAPRGWPLHRGDEDLLSPRDRPIVSLLFAGGVFRGVYLTGVVSALSELGLRPDVIAGASVGTITAAMTASVFASGGLAERRAGVARLASAFLALDRLVLTDRFADFVRGLTLRAASARVSLRDVDRLFRTYDRSGALAWSRETRRTLAALEQLLYLSPIDAADLAQSARRGQTEAVFRVLSDVAQKFLEKGGAGLEVLGAEPLAALVEHYVLATSFPGQPASKVPLSAFAPKGLYFLATATNLTRGRLEYLGLEELRRPERRALLSESLLASSAFPGVFRPRWAWELMPLCGEADQYVDGGVMDNLPLDAVAQFLNTAAEAGLIQYRPRVQNESVPHLMFTASLEVDPEHLLKRDVDSVAGSWWEISQRSSELGYNRKLDSYARLQRDLRVVREELGQPAPGEDRRELLDIDVVAVKPKWLCGTFAFHPMLGFRREKQAQSIAHGCARTLQRFQSIATDQARAHWLAAWRVGQSESRPRSVPPTAAERRRGCCHFRAGADQLCPFAPAVLVEWKGPSVSETLRAAVSRIYECCGDPKTHEPKG
jgi:predicted acylesterase/phospholipase RssA